MCSLRKIVQSAVNEARTIVKYQLAGQEENVKRLKTAFSAVLALSMALGMVVVPERPTALIRMRFIRNGYVERLNQLHQSESIEMVHL